MAEPRLPMDVLIEILILLPVKSILKFRCVSKTWRDLISSPLFIHRHLKCSRKQSVLLVKRTPNHGLLPQNGAGQILSFHNLDFLELLVSPDLSIPVLDDLNSNSYYSSYIPIHGPCNGLVCIALGSDVFLCNPALREFKLLPPLKFPESYMGGPLGYGFWFDQIGGVYKVIQIWKRKRLELSFVLYDFGENDINEISVHLYDSASNSWKQIDAKVPYVRDSPSVGVLTNGAIHWYAITAPGNFPCILCFDTSSEVFRQLDIHDDFPPAYERRLMLMELDGSLAMVSWSCSTFSDEPISEMEIWVMKEYGVKESWTKHFVIETCHIYSPLLFLKNEWLVFVTMDGQLAACTIHGNQFKEFEIHGFDLTALVYEESLISL